ncbi:MAG: hypothetical protein KatS3mg115_1404 [Candidatus Poribacteria bacterium]|nr:MAG: hypothetical protein KatS3mg115_1404 [Candidatus Poribacteria bacterium]
MSERVWVEIVVPLVRSNGVLIGAIWLWLLIGSLVAGWVVWRARLLRRPRGWPLGLMALLLPVAGILWLRAHRPSWAVQTPFGTAEPVGEALPPLRPPNRILLAALLGGLVPTLGQWAHRRVARALFLELMLSFAAFFIAAHLLAIERTWEVPKELLPESRRDESVVVQFRVPRPFYLLMLTEAALFLLFAYVDTVRLNDAFAKERVDQLPPIRRAYYRLRIERPESEPEERIVTRPSLTIGSDPQCGILVKGEAILPRHLDVYVHQEGEGRASLAFRCLDEERQALHNGTAAARGTLLPGDVLELGSVRLTFLPLCE